jgi:hypothetical protein
MAHAAPVKLKLSCWIKDGDYYTADVPALEADILAGGLTSAQISRASSQHERAPRGP